MHTVRAVAVVFFIAAISAAAVEDETESSASPSTNRGVDCSAFASLSVRLTDIGSCSGSATADCEAIAASENAFREAYDNWWDEDGLCEEDKAVVAARAMATAMAAVYTDTIAQVSCSGTGGFACGWAISRGDAYAIAFATAIAQASADAGNQDAANAFCLTDVSAKGGAIAEAAALSQANACISGIGSDIDFESSFIATMIDIIAEAFAEATVDACTVGVSQLQARANCEARSVVDVDPRMIGGQVGGGNFIGSTNSIPDCAGPIKNNCCDSAFGSRRCVCAGCNGPLTKLSTFDNGGLRTWIDTNGRICKCV